MKTIHPEIAKIHLIREQLFSKITKNLPAQYRWMANNDSKLSMSYDGMNPESYGQMKPAQNWRIVWSNNVATVVCHGGKIGRIEKATFKF